MPDAEPSLTRGIAATSSACVELEEGRFRRRTFLAAAGGAALSAALAGLPRALAERGWLDEAAAAAEVDLTRDTFNGLVAFVTPGDDEYSAAQGVATGRPGGIAAGTTGAMIEALDSLVSAPLVGGSTNTRLPTSGAVAQLLNNFALQVNAGASRGGFTSPFARLSFAEKGEVFRRLESEPALEGTPFRYLAGVLPTLVAALAFTEAPVLEGGRVTGTPLGWLISNYAGPSDGWREFRGYYRGRRAAANAHRYVRRRRRRRRWRRRRARRA